MAIPAKGIFISI